MSPDWSNGKEHAEQRVRTITATDISCSRSANRWRDPRAPELIEPAEFLITGLIRRYEALFHHCHPPVRSGQPSVE